MQECVTASILGHVRQATNGEVNRMIELRFVQKLGTPSPALNVQHCSKPWAWIALPLPCSLAALHVAALGARLTLPRAPWPCITVAKRLLSCAATRRVTVAGSVGTRETVLALLRQSPMLDQIADKMWAGLQELAQDMAEEERIRKKREEEAAEEERQQKAKQRAAASHKAAEAATKAYLGGDAGESLEPPETPLGPTPIPELFIK